MKYKIGDYVETSGAITGSGVIRGVVEGGVNIGMPWEDKTPHYVFTDERTGMEIIAHPRSLKLKKGGKDALEK